MRTYTLQVTRTVANQTFTVSTDVTFNDAMGADERLQIADTANAGLQYMLDRYMANVAPRQSNPGQGGPAAGSGSSSAAANVTVTKEKGIRMYQEFQKGKKYLKMTTASTPQHGLIIWPEVLKAGAVEEGAFPLEGADASGYTLTIETSPKGRRVTRIEVDF